jgi:hypothetical protein
MTMATRIRVVVLATLFGAFCFELSEQVVPPSVKDFFVPTVEAIVGRPLTPVSVAGVARRTSRRCSADVYDC